MTNAWRKRMLVLAVVGCLGAPAVAQTCRVDEAQNYYKYQRLDEAIHVLENCRLGDQWEGQKTDVLRLLALAYLERGDPGDTDLAWESVRLLLQADRRYSAPSDDPGDFRNLVKELRPKLWYQKRWVQAGAVAVIGGVLGVLLAPEPGPSPLPPPVLAPPN